MVTNDNTNRELKTRPLLGECQGNCGRNRKCASPYKCARFNQDVIEEAGYDNQFAYCDASGIKNKNDKYFCYDPTKILKKACPKGFTMSNQFETCNPVDWTDDSCLVTPVDSLYCCRTALEEYNSTHYNCQPYQSCPGYAACNCLNVGTDKKPEYTILCSSYTECHNSHQCV